MHQFLFPGEVLDVCVETLPINIGESAVVQPQVRMTQVYPFSLHNGLVRTESRHLNHSVTLKHGDQFASMSDLVGTEVAVVDQIVPPGGLSDSDSTAVRVDSTGLIHCSVPRKREVLQGVLSTLVEGEGSAPKC